MLSFGSSADSLKPNVWQHLAVVVTRTSVAFVLNDTTIASATRSPASLGAPWKLVFDAGVGQVADTRAYNRALSLNEIRSLAAFPYEHPNLPPVARAKDVAVACTGELTVAPLDASGSTDPNGDALTFAWSSTNAIDNASAAITLGHFPWGASTATVAVRDGEFTSTATAHVEVIDGAPPIITNLTPSEPGLYAKGQFVPGESGGPTLVVGPAVVAANVTDACSGVAKVSFYVDGAPVASVASVPYEFTYAPDGVGLQYHHVTISAVDRAGNVATASTDLTMLVAQPRAP